MSFNNVSTPDLLYYDIQITNIENQNSKPPVLTFIETRNNPFIYDTNQYEMSVIRFVLDTPNLPVFIPTIQPAPNTNINLTIYSVSLQWSNPVAPFQTFTQQTYITYIPQSLVAEIPPPPTLTENGLQFNAGQYYYIYNYQYFIYLINNAFITCFNALNAQVVGAGLVLPTTHAPVMSFDTMNNTAILNCDLLGYNTANPTNQISIFFNTYLNYGKYGKFNGNIFLDIFYFYVYENKNGVSHLCKYSICRYYYGIYVFHQHCYFTRAVW